MGTPYSAGPFEFSAPGGEETVVELRVPWRGIINTVRLNQVSGVEVDAAFRLYQSRCAANPGGSCGSEELPSDPDSYSVFGEKERTANTPFAEFEKNYPFVNKDGTPSNPQRRLYLSIEPEGSGDKEWSLSMEIDTSNLS